MHTHSEAMIGTRYPSVWYVSATDVAWYLAKDK